MRRPTQSKPVLSGSQVTRKRPSHGVLAYVWRVGSGRFFGHSSPKHNFRAQVHQPVAVLILCSFAALGFGSVSSAVEKVREGVRQFKDGDFDSAGKSFAEADVVQPDDLRILFDQACVYAVIGNSDKSRELMQKASLSRETDLAVRSHYNLGCLAAQQARALFGGKPTEATPEQRSQGLDLLASAVGHFRDCLRLESEHADARHNLEVIRLWIKQMQAMWQDRDREKTHEKMNVLEFLAMLEARQTGLRSVTRMLAGEANFSKRRQAFGETEDAQRNLTDEIEPLKKKIQSELKSVQPQAPPRSKNANAPPNPDEQTQKAVELLTRLADDTGQAMQKAADWIADGSHNQAIESQTRVLDNLNQIYMAVAPFANVLNRVVAKQQTLVDQSTTIQDAKLDNKSTRNRDTQQSFSEQIREPNQVPDQTGIEDAEIPEPDFPELARWQSRVAEWSRMLSLKARQELPQIEFRKKKFSAASPQTDDHTKQPNDVEAAHNQLQAIKESMNKALKLAPKARLAADEAVRHLIDKKSDRALPKQDEALTLLKEIAAALPKQDQSAQQPEQANESGEKQEQSKQSQLDKTSQPHDLSREQAQSVLRRARERERKHQRTQKELQRLLASPISVDRDW